MITKRILPDILFIMLLSVAVSPPVKGDPGNAHFHTNQFSSSSPLEIPSMEAASPGFVSSLMLPFSSASKAVKLSKIRYNRVEGFFLGVSPPELKKAHFELFGYIGYGFESYKWRYEIGLKRSWFWLNRLEIGVAQYDLTDSQDRWIISGLENTLAALLFREDFMDYYRRKGLRVFASQNISETYTFGLEFRTDRYESMDKRTDWSIFGGEKKFRHNPLIGEGKMQSLVASAHVDLMGYRQGWILQGEYEKAGDPFGGDFVFHRLQLQGKRYQRTFGSQQAVVRCMAGFHSSSAPDTVPEQKRFDLGGIESLRGHDFKEYTGDRMLLANIYYLFGGDLLNHTHIPIIQNQQLILFSDTGTAFDRFKGLQLRDFETDLGIAIADRENTFRINVAKRLDRKSDSIRITVRLLRKF